MAAMELVSDDTPKTTDDVDTLLHTSPWSEWRDPLLDIDRVTERIFKARPEACWVRSEVDITFEL
jgi:hypothetical protein